MTTSASETGTAPPPEPAVERAILAAGRPGVGGVNAWAAHATTEQRSGTAAVAAVRAWLSRGRFPASEVLAHYRAVGRARANPALVALLRSDRAHERAGSELLRRWLPMTFDHDSGDYDSYIGSPVLHTVVTGSPESMRSKVTDSLITLQAADLAVTETAAATTAEVGPRARSAVRVLARLPALAPDARFVRRVLGGNMSVVSAAPAAAFHADVAALCVRLAQCVPGDVRKAVELTLIPVTHLHDEVMFIRCIQIFEGIYHQVAHLVREATEAVASNDGHGAYTRLDKASARVEATPVLYRVLTTMPPDVFAVIRGHTHGRSAMQSRPFNEVQARCAPRDGNPQEPTLQDAYLMHRSNLGSETPRVAAAMRRLDQAWRSMKRTHWGVTLKVIGNVRGTGGTSGAAYLRASAEIPLFPALIPDGASS